MWEPVIKVLPRHRRQYDRTLIFRLPYIAVQCHVVVSRAVHCHCEVCSAAGGHFAACRKSCVCLHHRATVVTSNGVTIYSSQFPPTVSKHCQHQHSATPTTTQAMLNTNNPSSYDIQGAASSVHHHGHLRSQPQQFLL